MIRMSMPTLRCETPWNVQGIPLKGFLTTS